MAIIWRTFMQELSVLRLLFFCVWWPSLIFFSANNNFTIRIFSVALYSLVTVDKNSPFQLYSCSCIYLIGYILHAPTTSGPSNKSSIYSYLDGRTACYWWLCWPIRNIVSYSPSYIRKTNTSQQTCLSLKTTCIFGIHITMVPELHLQSSPVIVIAPCS